MSVYEFLSHNSEYTYPACGSHTDVFISDNIVAQDPVPSLKTSDEHNHSSAVQITRCVRHAVDTSIFTIEQRLLAAVWVHERKILHMSVAQIKRKFRERFGRSPPAKNTLLAWERKLFSTGSVCDAPRSGRPSTIQKHMAAVSESVLTAPSLSQRARASALRLPRSTLRTILHSQLRKGHTTSHQGTKQHSVHSQSNTSRKNKIKKSNKKEFIS